MRRTVANILRAGLVLACLGVPALAAAPEAVLDGNENTVEAEATEGNLRIRLSYTRSNESGDDLRVPVLELFVDGELVKRVEDDGNGFDWPRALAQIVELDTSNGHREVIFATYSGGAHCCNVRRILTSSEDGDTWYLLEPEPVDGDISGAEDVDGDGLYEIVHPDNAFYYTFSSYAGSFAPMQVLTIRDRQFVDISADARFLPLHRRTLERIQPVIDDLANQHEKNGFLAGYVALKNLLGEGEEAWKFMLEHHDLESDWGLSACVGGYDGDGECRETKTHPDFPAALEAFLQEESYID